MWRTVGDFWDSWLQLKEHFKVFDRWNQYRINGGWPDGDMLPLGHIGIRAERGVNRMSNFTNDEQKTLITLWSIFRSPLMFGGHLPDNDTATLALLTNKNVLHVLKHSENNHPLFTTLNNAVWIADDVVSKAKYVAMFNFNDQEMAMESKAVWKGNVINRNTINKSEAVEVNIAGAKKLYLVVKDGGDNIDWDHANWINPMLYNDKDSVSLTSLKFTKASAGWGNVQINTSISGGKLIVDGTQYQIGIGTHSNSVIEFDIPQGFTTFKALAGIDEAGAMQNAGATMQFMVFTQEPAGVKPPAEENVKINLKELGFKNPVVIKDLWTGKTVGTFSNEFSPLIKQHGCGFYKITNAKK
jgi:hypothetical protein